MPKKHELFKVVYLFNMLNKIANHVSNILSPMVVGPVSIFIISIEATRSILLATYYTLFLIILMLAPVMTYIIVQMKRGKISDIYVRKREQRSIIYAIQAIATIISLSILHRIAAPSILIAMTYDALLIGVLAFILNKKTKVSMHSGTIAGFTIAFYLIFGLTAGLIGFALTLLTMWARARIKAHTRFETILGSILGAVVTFLTLVNSSFLKLTQ